MSTFTLPLPVVAFLLKPYFRLAFNSRLPYRIQRLLLEAGAPLQQVPAGAVVRPLELACRPAEKITVGRNRAPHRSSLPAWRGVHAGFAVHTPFSRSSSRP